MKEPFEGKWIANADKDLPNPLFKKNFHTERNNIKQARLYATGLGVYNAYLDGKKIGNEFLTPGFTAYDQWVQIQTYDITDLLTANSLHDLVFSCADGWYKGNMGFDGGKNNIYGDQHMILADLYITYDDGKSQIIKTDKSWFTTNGQVTKSGIYYGEDVDATIKIENYRPVVEVQSPTSELSDRLSLPIVEHEKLDVKKVINTPKGELILDFGQNQAGWPMFYNHLPKGKKIILQMGEILQNGNFYNENLRKARASFTYISDGKKKWVHPNFTYFGYRYVKVTGVDKLNPEDFKAQVLYSDLKQTGHLQTNNEKVNRLFQNVIWGQRSNFMDVPTDCPQRDERLGWCGDSEIFSETANFNMDTFEFFRKYLRDIRVEQTLNGGKSPMFAPSLKTPFSGMAIWGDAICILNWNLYKFYGDKALLQENYYAMKRWVDWITANSKTADLWTGQMQLGDWLALDNDEPSSPKGKTDDVYIASLYYANSAHIVAQAAGVLNNLSDMKKYTDLNQRILQAIRKEYLSPNGRLTIDTQSAYVLALKFDLPLPKQKKHVIDDLVTRIHKDNDHLTTGFVGTPYLCEELSENGYHNLAVKIFLQEDYPSWLYSVNLGATTIWERWNSVLKDGKMNPAGMNSLNHYSLGAVMAWCYKDILGIYDHNSDFSQVVFKPHFDMNLSQVKGSYDSNYGKLKIDYELKSSTSVKINLEIPFGMKLILKLYDIASDTFSVNGKIISIPNVLQSGTYEIEYRTTKSLVKGLNLDIKISTLLEKKELVAKIDKIDKNILLKMKRPGNTRGMFISKSFKSLLEFESVDQQKIDKIKKTI